MSKISTVNSGDTVTVSHCRSVTVRTSLKSQRFETRTFSKPFIFRRDELFIYAEYLVNTDNAKTILTEVIQDNWHAGAVISQGRVTNLRSLKVLKVLSNDPELTKLKRMKRTI